MSLPTNRQDGDVIENEDINALASAINDHEDRLTSVESGSGTYGTVTSVNGVEPDESGNVTIEAGGVSASLDPDDPTGLTLLLRIPSTPSVSLSLSASGFLVTATFTGSSPDGLGLTYTIDWGDGPTSATSPATRTYPSVLATRTVTVTVTDSEGGTASDSQSIQLAPPGVSAYGGVVLADSPVVYYPMGDAALPIVDYTGNSTASTTGVLENVNMGDTARSLKLTTDASKVNLGQPAVLDDLAQFTFECLIRTNIPDEQGDLLYRGYVPSGTSAISGIHMRWHKATGIQLMRRKTGGDAIASSITKDFTSNDRLHVAGTYDATTGLKLYVNGVLQQEITGAWGNLPAAGTADWVIGKDGLYAQVAGVAMYNKVLTAARIQAHAAAAGL